MSSPPIPIDWNHLRAFLTTVEEGSLSAAARKLGLTQPTLSRQVAALEQELGILLFERIGRRLEITEGGRKLLEHSRAMGIAADRIALVALGQSQSIEGEIRITASDVFSAWLLPDALHRLLTVAPALRIDLIATNDIRDILRREADIAVRHLRPEQPDLIARLVRDASARLYAATDYLDKRGRPRSLSDLPDHDFISFGGTQQMLDHLRPLGMPLETENFRIGSDNGAIAWELARQGFGIMMMADEIADQTPGMELVLPDMAPVKFPIWLVTHREIFSSRRIRLVFDLLGEMLA